MKNPVQRYARPLATIATVILGSSILCQAANIAFTGFETTDTWGFTISGTGAAVSNANPSTDSPPSQRVLSGAQSLQINNGTATIDFNQIDVSAFDSIQLTIRISSPSATSGNGNDLTDLIKLFVSVNGAAYSANPEISLGGNGNAKWGYDATLTATTDAGTPLAPLTAQSGGLSTNNYSTFVVNIPSSANTVGFKIVGNNDNAGEFWAVDNVSLTGTAAPVPEPGSMIALFGGVGMLFGFRRLRPIPRIG